MKREDGAEKKVLMVASVASMIDQFNRPNIRLLLDLGYEVHVMCNFREGNTCSGQRIKELQKTLKNMNVICHQWDCPRSIVPAVKCCRAFMQLWKLTSREQYEWIHCQSPIGGALARLVMHRRGIRVIYTAHGFHFYRGAPLKNWLLYYPAERLLAYWTDVLITVNKEDYRFAKRKLRASKIYYIPGVGIDTAMFAGLQPQCARKSTREQFCRKYHIPQDAIVLLSVGELNRGKNHRMVIGALAALARQDVHYLICGQGKLRRKLQQYADRRGVGNCIHLPGYQEHIEWIYPNADLFVFPSVREGMPVALMEAMAAGMPCVVSDIRGNRELIQDIAETANCGRRASDAAAPANTKSGGIRFSLKQPWQLRQGLARMIEDDRLRQECGRHNQEKIRKYDQAVVQRKMRKIYQKMDDRNAFWRHSKWERIKNAGDFCYYGNLQRK